MRIIRNSIVINSMLYTLEQLCIALNMLPCVWMVGGIDGGGNFFREAIKFLVNEALYIQLLVLIITSPIMVNERLAVSMSNWVSLAWKS